MVLSYFVGPFESLDCVAFQVDILLIYSKIHFSNAHHSDIREAIVVVHSSTRYSDQFPCYIASVHNLEILKQKKVAKRVQCLLI